MRNASEEERIKNELKEQEWLRQAILTYDENKSAVNTSIRVNHLTQVSGRIAKLQRELYECQHTATY